ncbi:hypothetical protein CEXT_578141 [Caerostris extrusa]|uniref:Uncharacterized protein n=1 Tax=Caerostris extrusa TaxID=172846 RepID=A0AAV4Y8D0_CAEEX|nr:hypothetical protein CEXT_578141 [Caerostris extrusa]
MIIRSPGWMVIIYQEWQEIPWSGSKSKPKKRDEKRKKKGNTLGKVWRRDKKVWKKKKVQEGSTLTFLPLRAVRLFCPPWDLWVSTETTESVRVSGELRWGKKNWKNNPGFFVSCSYFFCSG